MALERHERTCPGKVQHPTEEGAVLHLIGLKIASTRSGEMSHYLCTFCGYWHVGHTPKSLRQPTATTEGNPMATTKPNPMATTKPNPKLPPLPAPLYVPGYQLVDPALAQLILTECKYPRQRKLMDDRVEFLAEQLEKGNWETTAITVLHCQENGHDYLVDGQHRLNAILIAGKPGTLCLIMEDKATMAEVDAAYRRLDGHRPRTLQDRLRASDLSDVTFLNDWEIRQLGHAVAVLATGFGENNPHDRRRNPVAREDDLRIQLIREWADDARKFFDCLKGCNHAERNAFRNPTLIAVALVTIRYRPQEATRFWTTIAQNDGLERDTPEWVFRNRVFAEGQTGQQRTEWARKIAVCWNHYFKGNRSLKAVIVKNPGANIELLGTPYSYERRITLLEDEKNG